MPTINIDNTQLYYETRGRGRPLLLIAGLGSDSSSWAGITEPLSEKFNILIFDSPGTGRSGQMEKPFTVEHMAQYAVGLLDHLEISRTHILGHSLGGYVAQEIAASHPHRVDKLILESTSYISSKRNNELFTGFFNELEKGSDYERWIRTWADWLFSQKNLKDKEFVDTFVKYAVEYPLRQGADGFRAQVQALASFDGKDNARHIKAGTLVLEGADDRLITPPEAEALAKSITGSSYKLVEDAGHSLHIEKPKEFLRIVQDFLKKRD